MRGRLILCAAFALGCAGALPAQVSGVIVDAATGNGIAGARVGVKGTPLIANADSTGAFVLTGIGPGKYVLEIHTPALDSIGSVNQMAVTLTDSVAQLQLRVRRPGDTRAVFKGTVLADGTHQPIRGAQVFLTDINVGAVTDSAGAFRIADVPLGTHQLSVRRVGYSPADAELGFTSASTIARTVYLAQVTTLDSVVVESRVLRLEMEDFDRNRKMGFGKFFDREELEAARGRPIGDILRSKGLPVVGLGVHAFVVDGRGPKTIDPRRTQQRLQSDKAQGAPAACYAAVYLDNALVFAPGRGNELFDLSQFGPEDLAGIEYYPGSASIPERYKTLDVTCGVIVLHLKKG